ncbi:MAG: Fe-S cluster assembly protein NifU [Desulfobacterota bacterium]|jgi:NifU-like protein|nr:Fe-S cluster assembly protein NifU [Thermodesulfobacteriota bacterium]
MWDYTEKVKEYFENPKNIGEVENPDGVGEVGSLACGDALRLTFKLDEDQRIKEARFQTFGCASAIASSSALTELIQGKTLEEAEKLTNKDIAAFLGGLPKEKMHCSVLGEQALSAAIANYRGRTIPKQQEGEIVCECFGVTDKEIERVIRENGLKTREEVTNYTKAGGGCETCHDKIEALLARVLKEEREARPAEGPPRPALTNIRKMKLIEETLEREIKPALKADGGDIDLIDIDGNKVLVALRGACSSCRAAEVTLKDYVELKLKEFVTPEITVEEVKP